MPSPNFCAGLTCCTLRAVMTSEDAVIYMQTRTANTHALGVNPPAVLARLMAPGRHAFVIESGVGVPVGTCSLTEVEPGIAVAGVAILPTFRGAGYGMGAMKALEGVAIRLGFMTLRADVFEDNVPGVRLVEKMGYRPYRLYEKPLKG